LFLFFRFQVRERLKVEIEKNTQLKDELDRTNSEVRIRIVLFFFKFSFDCVFQLVSLRETQQSKLIDIDQLKVNSIFKLFDYILLMSKGKCFYQGPANEMLTYFNTNGYQCEPHDNPADFALDVLIDVSSKCDDFQRLINIYGEVHAEKFLSKTLKYTDELEQLRRKQTGRAARTFQTEIYFVAQRTLKNSIRLRVTIPANVNAELIFEPLFPGARCALLTESSQIVWSKDYQQSNIQHDLQTNHMIVKLESVEYQYQAFWE